MPPSTSAGPSAPPTLKRGVYRAPFVTTQGYPILAGVDRYGVLAIPHRPVWPFEDYDSVLEGLWDRLDELDPPD